MPYVFSMTARMATIAGFCILLLCVLLFVLGVEIGARYATPSPAPGMSGTPAASEHAPLPAVPNTAASAASASNAS